MAWTGEEKKGAQVFGVTLMAVAVVLFLALPLATALWPRFANAPAPGLFAIFPTLSLVALSVGFVLYILAGHGALLPYLWVEGFADICRDRFGPHSRFSVGAIPLWPLELVRRAISRLAPGWYRRHTWGDFGGEDHGVRAMLVKALRSSPHRRMLERTLVQSHEVLVRMLHPDSRYAPDPARLDDLFLDLPMRQAHVAIVGLILCRTLEKRQREPALQDLFAAAEASVATPTATETTQSVDADLARLYQEACAKVHAYEAARAAQERDLWASLAEILGGDADEDERATRTWDRLTREVAVRAPRRAPPELRELFAESVGLAAREVA